MEKRVVDDIVHISKPTMIFYVDPNEMHEVATINETRSRGRFEELFTRYRNSFEYGYKAYIRNLQNNKVIYSLPYKKSKPDKYGRTETFFPVEIDFSDCPEHTFGLPNKKDADTQRLLRKLVKVYKDGLKEDLEEDQDRIDPSKLTEEEKIFLSNLGKEDQIDELLSYSNLDDNSFEIQTRNVISKLNNIQDKYKNKSAIQKEIIYQVHNLREIISIINENNYGSEQSYQNFIDTKFVDEASNIIIRDLARSSKQLPIMKNTKKGQSELEKLVRLNLSMFCINLNKEKFYDDFKKSETLIKDKVYDKLATKYVNTILDDNEILLELENEKAISINPVTNRRELDSNFIDKNLNRNTIKNFEGYNVDQLASLIKKPSTSQSREEIIDNIDTYVGVINELDRIISNEKNEEAELARELVRYDLLEMLVLNDYQMEFAKRSLHNIIKEKIKNETNILLNQRVNSHDGIKNHYHLNKLYCNNKRQNHLMDLAEELNKNDGLALEEELYKIENKARQSLFDKEVLKTKMNREKYEDLPDISNINKKYDMVEMIYLLTSNDRVKEKLYEIYSQNYDSESEFTPSINYLKIAEKSEVIAEIGRINDLSPIIRRVREEVSYGTGSVSKPADSYMNNAYAKDNNINFNNAYILEFVNSKDSSNAIYLSPGSKENTLHMSHAIKDIQLVDLGNNDTRIIAEVDNYNNYLPTPIGFDKQIAATIKSSNRIILEKPKKVTNEVMNEYKERHNEVFKTIKISQEEKESLKNETSKSSLYTEITLDDKDNKQSYEIHSFVKNPKEEINEMFKKDKIEIHNFVKPKNDLDSMFNDNESDSSNQKKL